jgi:ATP-dependent Clp protease ATP-binding subunit ClpA
LETAAEIAKNYGNSEISSLHLLLTLLADTDGIVIQVLDKKGVNIANLNDQIEHQIQVSTSINEIQEQHIVKIYSMY